MDGWMDGMGGWTSQERQQASIEHHRQQRHQLAVGLVRGRGVGAEDRGHEEDADDDEGVDEVPEG